MGRGPIGTDPAPDANTNSDTSTDSDTDPGIGPSPRRAQGGTRSADDHTARAE